LDVAEIDAGVEHGGDVGVSEHVWVQCRHPHPGRLGKSAQSAGGGVPAHPGAAGVEQDRPTGPAANRLIEGSADGWREWDEDGLAALAEDADDAVAVFLRRGR
jgi:hypothetical protein